MATALALPDPEDRGTTRRGKPRKTISTGRPTKLTYVLDGDGLPTWTGAAADFLDAITTGNHFEIAARYAGIHPDTAYGWLERAQLELDRIADGGRVRAAEAPFVAFSEALTRASATAEALILGAVVGAIGKRPEVGLKLLATRYPERWRAPAAGLEVSGPRGGPVPVAVAGVDDLLAVLDDLVTQADAAEAELLVDDEDEDLPALDPGELA